MPKPTKTTQPRRKAVYHIRNWKEYDRALVERGSLTMWVSDEVQQAWRYRGPAQRGAQFEYSDQAIECALTVREVFQLSQRATEGFLRSLFQLLEVDLPVPDHTTLSRRGQTLTVRLPKRARGILHLVMDSSGLKVYGEGEWKVRQHGYSQRRTWRKIHLTVDAGSSEIQATVLTENSTHDAEVAADLLAQVERPAASVGADGAYDRATVYAAIEAHSPEAVVNIPPRRDAKIHQHGNSAQPPLKRDENLRYIRQHGRRRWKQDCGYHRRSLAETALFRLKTVFGDHVSNRRLESQRTQAMLRAAALNRMTHLGMPQSYKVA